MNEQAIRLDRMRFTKNTTSSRLALLAIVFDVLYFVSVYKTNMSFYYAIIMGASILYNLIFMLAAFLNYKQSYSYLLFALGVIQIVRIFILPAQAHSTVETVEGVEMLAMSDGQFVRVTIYLVASAVCLFAAGFVNLTKSRALAAHIAGLEGQKA